MILSALAAVAILFTIDQLSTGWGSPRSTNFDPDWVNEDSRLDGGY